MYTPSYDRALAHLFTLGCECASPYLVVDVFVKLSKRWGSVKILSLNSSTLCLQIDADVIRIWKNHSDSTFYCALENVPNKCIQFNPVRFIHGVPRSVVMNVQASNTPSVDEKQTASENHKQMEMYVGHHDLCVTEKKCALTQCVDVLTPIYTNWTSYWPEIVDASIGDTWTKYKSAHFSTVHDNEFACDTVSYLSDDIFVDAIVQALTSRMW